MGPHYLDLTSYRLNKIYFDHFQLGRLEKFGSPPKYPYFDVVVGLVWSHDAKSYAGGSVCYW
jgi:hypothetical protein